MENNKPAAPEKEKRTFAVLAFFIGYAVFSLLEFPIWAAALGNMEIYNALSSIGGTLGAALGVVVAALINKRNEKGRRIGLLCLSILIALMSLSAITAPYFNSSLGGGSMVVAAIGVFISLLKGDTADDIYSFDK